MYKNLDLCKGVFKTSILSYFGDVYAQKKHTIVVGVEERVWGKTALLVQGARRVGKSYIVEEFAKKEYRSYILIDFNKAGEQGQKIFSTTI